MNAKFQILVALCLGALAPALGNPALQQSYVLEGQKNYEGAVRSMASLYNEKSEDFFVNLRMGWLNFMNGNYKNAVTHYEKSIVANRRSVTAWQGIIATLEAQWRWKEAITAARSLAELLPNDITTSLKLANLLIVDKNYGGALEVLHKVSALYPDHIELQNTLGYAMKLNGDKVGAGQQFRRVLAMVPENEIALKYSRELAGNAP